MVRRYLTDIKKNETILISGSMKFKEEMASLTSKLKVLGYTKIIDPNNNVYSQKIELIEKAQNHKIFENLIENENANLLLVYNKNGYIGLSSAMEIQKALDYNVPVRFLLEPNAIEFKALCLHPDYNVKVDKKYLE
jgi:hypothetical protein